MNRTFAAGLVLGLAAVTSACAPTVVRNRAAIEKLPNACQDQTVEIYFESDSSVVTPEAEAVLKGAADMARGCTVDSVRVIGLADAVGAAGANQALSEARARTTTISLAKVGFTAPKFEVAAAGDAGALTPDGQARPLRRRADVVVELSPAK
ncbi:MAG: hypothetical protein BGN86_02885 [Caulobacterales bacterium 68-7]|nr:OmpA family protein [Caulobacterales bacterium]OJU10549.1 MAG: hypothetical protein BGN86_02885 [Caulobacterales bacterium 68-7]